MTAYTNAGAGSEALSIQYDIDRLTADVRSGGNQAIVRIITVLITTIGIYHD